MPKTSPLALCQRRTQHFQRAHRGGISGFDAEFFEEVLQVLLHRILGRAVYGGDFAVALALGDPEQHFGFTRGQRKPREEMNLQFATMLQARTL